MERPLDRRTFLLQTAAAGAALGLGACRSGPKAVAPRPADAPLRVGVIGLKSRGRDHVQGLASLPHVQVVALCDVDRRILDAEAARQKEQGRVMDGYQDLRELLARGDLDALSIATPNHWHALATVWAMQAGLDVYVEKPVSHDFWEGAQMVAAARQEGRIVQAGTQSRSSQAIRDAFRWLQEGGLGRILWAQGLCYKPRPGIGKVAEPTPVPDAVDYDLWCGPTPVLPLRRKELHYDWHWLHVTGNGDLGNQGIHQMDLCRWGIGSKGLPSRVWSVGGRLGYDDDGDTPNSQVVVLEYPEAPIVFEVRGLPRDKAGQKDWGRSMDQVHGCSVGAVIHCEQGVLRLPDYQSAVAVDRQGREVKRWKGARSHYLDFCEVVRSRRQQDLAADIEEGHLSSALCHLGMIAQRLGVAASPAEVTRTAAGNPRAAEATARLLQHLLQNEVDLERTPLTLGPWLAFDPVQQRFPESPAANLLLRAKARAPFALPELVPVG